MYPYVVDAQLEEHIVNQRRAAKTWEIWNQDADLPQKNAMWASLYIQEQLELTTVLNESVDRSLGLLKDKSLTPPLSEEQKKGMLDTMTECVNEATKCQHKIRGALDFLAKRATIGLYETQEETDDTRQAKRPRVETELPADYPQVKTDMEYPVDKGTQTDAPSPAEAPTSLAKTWLAWLA